jgi:hypothetical protein
VIAALSGAISSSVHAADVGFQSTFVGQRMFQKIA